MAPLLAVINVASAAPGAGHSSRRLPDYRPRPQWGERPGLNRLTTENRPAGPTGRPIWDGGSLTAGTGPDVKRSPSCHPRFEWPTRSRAGPLVASEHDPTPPLS